MTATLRKLLDKLFDYAGLFPPAQLPLAEALRHYRTYQASADAWMLAGFVCGVGHLQELADSGNAIPVCVVAPGYGSEAEARAGLRPARDAIVSYQTRAAVRSFEIRLPPGCSVPFFREVREMIPAAVMVFFEAPADEKLHDQVLRPVAEIGSSVGFKLRCGGSTAASVPTVNQIVSVLERCRRWSIPLKLTAGLHHPLRTYDPTLHAETHGFVNLLLADLLLRTGKIAETQAARLLEDKQPEHFEFGEEKCGWSGIYVSLAEMERAGRGVVSIGSCSFDEPRDDLRKLGWW